MAFCAKADTANAGTRKLWEKRQESGQKEIACARARVLCIETEGRGSATRRGGEPQNEEPREQEGERGNFAPEKILDVSVRLES